MLPHPATAYTLSITRLLPENNRVCMWLYMCQRRGQKYSHDLVDSHGFAAQEKAWGQTQPHPSNWQCLTSLAVFPDHHPHPCRKQIRPARERTGSLATFLFVKHIREWLGVDSLWAGLVTSDVGGACNEELEGNHSLANG